MTSPRKPAVTLRVLIVEDGADRQADLQALFREHAWVLAHTASRAARLVQAFEFDLICLDFDLAGPGDGETVARAILESTNANTPVLVHSMNAPAAAKLAEVLPAATCIPITAIFRSNAVVKRIRLALLSGVPADWPRLVWGGDAVDPGPR